MVKFIKISAVALLLCTISKGQTDTDSLELLIIPFPNSLTTNFDKLLNTYSLNTRFYFLQETGDFTFNIHENYHSNFIKSNNNSIRDEQYLSLSSAYKVSNILRIGLYGNNNILSDDRKIEINQASISNAAFFLQVSPINRLDLVPFAGFTDNRQVGERDNGMLYGGEGLLNGFELSEFIINSSFKFRNEDISPRRNLLRSYRLRINNNLENNVFNNIDFNYGLNRKDFYYEADSLTSSLFNVDNNIQSRTESSYLIQDRLQYVNPAADISVELYGRLARRNIDRETRYKTAEVLSPSVFDTEVREDRIEFEGIANYRSSFFSGSVRALVSERDEKHFTKNFTGIITPFYEERERIEVQKNNNSARASVSLLGSLYFSSSDILYFSVLQNKLKYDTPSELNFDDRDELLTIIRLRYSRRLSPFFEAFLNTEGSQNKTVYIFSEKSSNNNINRVLRFSAGGQYRGKNVASLNTFEVTANYTVYDYEDLNPNYRSFSFRQLTALDSTYITFTRTLGASVYGYVKLSEQGDLKWVSFSTRPTRYLEEIYAEPKFHLTWKKVIFSAGLRFFSLNTYHYDKREKVLFSRYQSRGPLAEILYNIENNIYLKFYGWYEFIRNEGDADREQANLNLQMIWNI